MPKTKISEFSATPANNTDIDSINIAEGCAPSGINDAIRELMAQLKDFQTGAVGDSFNGPVNGTVGATTASTGAFTTLAASGAVTLSGGTANGVAYLNGSKVVTSGSALTFDGTNFEITTGSLSIQGGRGSTRALRLPDWSVYNSSTGNGLVFDNGSEQMRLTSTGLGIGTSSPSTKLTVHAGADGDVGFFRGGSTRQVQIGTSSTAGYINTDNGSAGLELRTNGTARATIDTSGNLGLGVTPKAWVSGAKALQVGGFLAAWTQQNGSANLGFGVYEGASNTYTYMTNGDAPTLYRQLSGVHSWSTAPSGTAGNAITFSQAMTLEASGRWLLGTTTGVGNDFTSIRFNSSGTYSQGMNMVDANASSNSGVFMVFRKSDDTALGAIKRSGTDTALAIDGNSYLAFQTGETERARIDSSGNLLVGQTAVGFSNTDSVYISPSIGSFVGQHASGTASGTGYAIFTYSGGQIGSITQNGTTAVAYNTSSDYRLKNTITPMTGALAKVAQLKPVTYKWNADGSDGQGFIAHELAEVCPDAVTGEKDAVDAQGNPQYQGIDTSFLVATLTAAIKEQQAIIESLKARLDAANL